MAKADDIKTLAAQRVRELMSKASGWEQSVDVKVGGQTADLVMKFKMGDKPHTLAIGVTSLGQPRQIREAVTRLLEIRKDMPEAYPVAVSRQRSSKVFLQTTRKPKRRRSASCISTASRNCSSSTTNTAAPG